MRADFSSQDYFRNPAAEIEKLRSAGPVVDVRFPIVGKVWTTTTQDLADRVLKDSETFTIRRDDGTVAGFRWWMPRILLTLSNHMLSMDEPDHRRLRDIVDEAFRRRAVRDMEPRILAIADELAGELFAQGSPADLVDRYARTLPLSVICELLGLPLADRPKFTAWARRITGLTRPIGFLGMIPNMLAMRRYLENHLESVRQQGGEGLVAELVRVEKEGGQISRNEMVSMVFLLLFAGHETTTNLLGNGLFHLLRHPEQAALVRADPSLFHGAVEELLRYDGPVQRTARIPSEDVAIGGKTIGKGEMVMPFIGAADRDPAQFPEPDRLDIGRTDNRHIAFGWGIHFCLGAPLARVEGQIAINTLVRRLPRLAFVSDTVEYRQSLTLRGLKALPVKF